MQLAAFTKSFQDWPIDRVGREFKQLGLDGIDLTVRKGGTLNRPTSTKVCPRPSPLRTSRV